MTILISDSSQDLNTKLFIRSDLSLFMRSRKAIFEMYAGQYTPLIYSFQTWLLSQPSTYFSNLLSHRKYRRQISDYLLTLSICFKSWIRTHRLEYDLLVYCCKRHTNRLIRLPLNQSHTPAP